MHILETALAILLGLSSWLIIFSFFWHQLIPIAALGTAISIVLICCFTVKGE